MKLAAFALAAAFAASLVAGAGGAASKRPLRVGYVVAAGFTPNKSDLFGLPYAKEMTAFVQL